LSIGLTLQIAIIVFVVVFSGGGGDRGCGSSENPLMCLYNNKLMQLIYFILIIHPNGRLSFTSPGYTVLLCYQNKQN
jgi:hypothetical protein